MALTVSIAVQVRLHDLMTDCLTARAPFDGWAEDVTEPNSYKDYYYPNGTRAKDRTQSRVGDTMLTSSAAL